VIEEVASGDLVDLRSGHFRKGFAARRRLEEASAGSGVTTLCQRSGRHTQRLSLDVGKSREDGGAHGTDVLAGHANHQNAGRFRDAVPADVGEVQVERDEDSAPRSTASKTAGFCRPPRSCSSAVRTS